MFKRLERLLKFGPLSMTFIDDGAGGEAAASGDAGSASDLSTAEKALEFWDKPEDQAGAAADDEGSQQHGDDGQAAAEGAGKAGADGKAENEGQQLSEEQLQADPRFQELSKFQQDIKPVFEKYGVPDARELDLQLADSQVLYSIMAGKGTPSQLLDTMAQASHWSDEQKQGVARDLIGWLTKNGYLKDGGQSASGGRADGKFKDPLEERLDKFEQDREAEKRQAADRVEKERQSKIFDIYKGEVNRLAKEKGLDPADFDFIGREVRALIKPEEFKGFVEAVEKGNFVRLRELFAQVHNREVARLKRWTSSQTQSHERRTRSAPRVPAGGSPPAPAGQQKRNLSNRDDRLAAAEAEWNK